MKMELTYRGVQYDYDPPTIDMMEGEAGGLYRGCQWQVRYPRHIPIAQPSHSLKYRAVGYCTHAASATRDLDLAPDSKLVDVATTKKRKLLSHSKPQNTIWLEAARIHQANICRRLERRMNVAQAKGDLKLINMLQQESQDLACALS